MAELNLAFEFIGSGRHFVIYCHGLPSGKSFARLHREAFDAYSIKCLSFDRPGFGQSPLMLDTDFFDDARQILNLVSEMGITKFSVIGVSCGGPLAAAIAYLAQDKCRFLGLLVAMPPGAGLESSLNKKQLPFLRRVFISAKKRGWLSKLFFKCDAFFIRRNAEKALRTIESLLCDSDKDLLRENRFRDRFIFSLKEAYSRGPDGAINDAYRVANCDTAFLREIQCPTVYYRAGLDRHVTADMSSVYLSSINGITVRDYPADGHVSIMRTAEEDMCSDVTSAMAD